MRDGDHPSSPRTIGHTSLVFSDTQHPTPSDTPLLNPRTDSPPITPQAVPARVGHTSLVRLFNPRYLPHVLGFKFQFYQKEAMPNSL
jgi:hypothetical protein